jgi:hypothetical protein
VESKGGPINYSDAAWVARVPFVPLLIPHRSATEPGLASFISIPQLPPLRRQLRRFVRSRREHIKCSVVGGRPRPGTNGCVEGDRFVVA